MKRFILLALFASCALFSFGPTTKAKGGPSQTWSVTIENTLSDNSTATMIRSDLFSDPPTNSKPVPYTSSVDGVSISSQTINFWPGSDSGARNVYFDHDNPLYPCGAEDPCTDGLPSPMDFKTPVPRGLTGTGQSLVFPRAGGPGGLTTPMENMALGSFQCGNFYWVVTDSSGSGWRVPNFHYNVANVPESSYVVVTRNSATQWTVESAHGACSDNPYNVGMVLHGETTTVHGKSTTTTYADGYYYVPFRLTYTLQ
jgi:hypothetical protein